MIWNLGLVLRSEVLRRIVFGTCLPAGKVWDLTSTATSIRLRRTNRAVVVGVDVGVRPIANRQLPIATATGGSRR